MYDLNIQFFLNFCKFVATTADLPIYCFRLVPGERSNKCSLGSLNVCNIRRWNLVIYQPGGLVVGFAPQGREVVGLNPGIIATVIYMVKSFLVF